MNDDMNESRVGGLGGSTPTVRKRQQRTAIQPWQLPTQSIEGQYGDERRTVFRRVGRNGRERPLIRILDSLSENPRIRM